jgi:hypothetical protein
MTEYVKGIEPLTGWTAATELVASAIFSDEVIPPLP